MARPSPTRRRCRLAASRPAATGALAAAPVWPNSPTCVGLRSRQARPTTRSEMYTTGHAFLDALTACGVTHIFANFGSDHPALIEAIAEARAAGKAVPRIITSPHEMVGMSAAHGFYQAS